MKMVLGMILFLTSQVVFADSLINCKTTGKKPSPVLEYTVRGTPSLRLSSDIVYTNNGTAALYPISQVAQYGTQKEAIYLLVDNSQEIPIFRLFAKSAKKGYNGNVATYNAAGKIVKTTAVDCTISAL